MTKRFLIGVRRKHAFLCTYEYTCSGSRLKESEIFCALKILVLYLYICAEHNFFWPRESGFFVVKQISLFTDPLSVFFPCAS